MPVHEELILTDLAGAVREVLAGFSLQGAVDPLEAHAAVAIRDTDSAHLGVGVNHERAVKNLGHWRIPSLPLQLPRLAAQRIGAQRPATALTGPDPATSACRQVAIMVNWKELLVVRLQRFVGRRFATNSSTTQLDVAVGNGSQAAALSSFLGDWTGSARSTFAGALMSRTTAEQERQIHRCTSEIGLATTAWPQGISRHLRVSSGPRAKS